MYFKATFRHNPSTDKVSWYYRLVESYRNALGEARQRTLLSVGFLDELTGKQIDELQEGLNHRVEGLSSLFPVDGRLGAYIEQLYGRLISEKKIDRLSPDKQKSGDWDTVDLNTLRNKDIHELGAEWMSLQAFRELGIDGYLSSRGWSAEEIALASAHVVSRAVYPASELKSVRFIQENSAVCELTGYDKEKVTKDRLYAISRKLYAEKQGLENHLSHRTNELFDLEDKIILYDLTNTYFEGEKRSSGKARRERSKEKRCDCRLLVLALVVNCEGFIKYSSIYEGNKSDSSTLPDMIDKLRLATNESSTKAIVVIDARIATEDNLKLIRAKGYDYVCVSRSNLKKYSNIQGSSPVKVFDKRKREIELVQVQTEKPSDSQYYLKVSSQGKALKEESMHGQFCQRYEEGLQIISKGIESKHGTKKYDKVNQRIGRLRMIVSF